MSEKPAISATDEQQLWRLLKIGDPASLEEIFRRYYRLLYDYGMRFYAQDDLIKDAIQDLFAQIWKSSANLGDVSDIRSYLMAALRRSLLKNLARQRKTVSFVAESHLDGHQSAQSAEETVIGLETDHAQKEQARTILNDLPPRLREALYLKIFQGFGNQQIAETMGISYQVATNYLAEALQRLRRLKENSDLPL